MNILIVGLGSIAQKHIKALRLLNIKCCIYALRSNKDVDIQDGVTNIYDLDDLRVPVFFAIISNPTHLHARFIDILAEKGIPLFIEKPPIHILTDAETILEKINTRQTITYVACNLRFHPCLKYVKDVLCSDEIKRVNEVNVYCGSYLPDWRPGKDFRATYSSDEAMGGGVHLDLFHELDYTQWIFGKPINSNCIKKNNSSLNIDACDYANYVLDYQKFAASIILNYYRRKPKRIMEILFEQDTWLVDILSNKISNDKGDIVYQVENFNITDTYVAQMSYFIDCLKSNQIPMNSLTESIEILKTCLTNEI